MIIYKTTNNINGKIYVGKDARNNPKYIGSGNLIKRAIIKYGFDNFTKEILEVCTDLKQLSNRERFWITELNATNTLVGYNIAEGGQGGNLGEQVNKLIGEKSRKYKSNRTKEVKELTLSRFKETIAKRTPEEKAALSVKYSKGRKGKKSWNSGKTGIYSSETLQRLSMPRPRINPSTYVRTKEHCDNISQSKLGSKPSHCKKVYRYSLDLQSYKEYPTVTLAASENSVAKSNIKRCADGDFSQMGGYKWSYSIIENKT
jgi:group I intron endonuclease